MFRLLVRNSHNLSLRNMTTATLHKDPLTGDLISKTFVYLFYIISFHFYSFIFIENSNVVKKLEKRNLKNQSYLHLQTIIQRILARMI